MMLHLRYCDIYMSCAYWVMYFFIYELFICLSLCYDTFKNIILDMVSVLKFQTKYATHFFFACFLCAFIPQNTWWKGKQGPVIQSIVSLTSSLVVKMLTVLVRRISNSQVFLLKNVSSFCKCKSYSHFFSKNSSILCHYLMIKVLTIH